MRCPASAGACRSVVVESRLRGRTLSQAPGRDSETRAFPASVGASAPDLSPSTENHPLLSALQALLPGTSKCPRSAAQTWLIVPQGSHLPPTTAETDICAT